MSLESEIIELLREHILQLPEQAKTDTEVAKWTPEYLMIRHEAFGLVDVLISLKPYSNMLQLSTQRLKMLTEIAKDIKTFDRENKDPLYLRWFAWEFSCVSFNQTRRLKRAKKIFDWQPPHQITPSLVSFTINDFLDRTPHSVPPGVDPWLVTAERNCLSNYAGIIMLKESVDQDLGQEILDLCSSITTLDPPADPAQIRSITKIIRGKILSKLPVLVSNPDTEPE